MVKNQTSTSIIVCIAIAIFSIAAQINSSHTYKNLKVLPKDITETKLDSIMKSYNKALNVSCDFCHIKAMNSIAGSASDTLDFSLDNKMKDEARQMIRMMNDINKTHFYFDTSIRVEYLNVVSCNTCHRGNPFPAHE